MSRVVTEPLPASLPADFAALSADNALRVLTANSLPFFQK